MAVIKDSKAGPTEEKSSGKARENLSKSKNYKLATFVSVITLDVKFPSPFPEWPQITTKKPV